MCRSNQPSAQTQRKPAVDAHTPATFHPLPPHPITSPCTPPNLAEQTGTQTYHCAPSYLPSFPCLYIAPTLFSSSSRNSRSDRNKKHPSQRNLLRSPIRGVVVGERKINSRLVGCAGGGQGCTCCGCEMDRERGARIKLAASATGEDE